MVRLKAPGELFPEHDLFTVQKLRVKQLLALICLDLNINLVLALPDEPVVVLEVGVYLSCELPCEPIECLPKLFHIELLQLNWRRHLLLLCRKHRGDATGHHVGCLTAVEVAAWRPIHWLDLLGGERGLFAGGWNS